MKQEERTELTRKKIMKAAVNEFGSYGYEGDTIGRICKTGSINKGLIYHNFKDKDALYLACMKESCDLLMDMFKDMDQKTAPALSIAQDFHCKGPVTDTLLPMAVLDDIVGIIVFFSVNAVVTKDRFRRFLLLVSDSVNDLSADYSWLTAGMAERKSITENG